MPGKWIKKIDVSGTINCQLCSDTIYYGKRGFNANADHIKRKKHASKVIARKTNYILPANYFGIPNLTTSCLSETSAPFASTSNSATQMPINVPLADRITNAQSLVLGVLAENNLH